MKISIDFLSVALVVSLLAVACQKTKKTEDTAAGQAKLPVATLSKTTYTIGDSMAVQLAQPVTHVTVVWDGKPTSGNRALPGKLAVPTVGMTVGLHQLIINGVTADKAHVADTLTVELWSDIIPQKLAYTVAKTYPHQDSSFTQGLEFHRGSLYESTGLNGQSRLMQVNLATGAIIKSVPLPEQYFGEGITIVNDKIYQLTWTSGQCFRYTMDFALDKTFTYPTQGWGLTHQDTTLILSDGTNKLSFYTPGFQKTGELVVYDNKGPVVNLNELEYINGFVLANVWQTNRIVLIDLKSGKVVGELTMDAIVPVGVDARENVLNGIAYYPEERALYVTGKKWPSLFRLRVPGLRRATSEPTVAVR